MSARPLSSTVRRFRRPDRLRVGDPLPASKLLGLEDGAPVSLDVARRRPSARSRLRQLHLTALSSPVGRRRDAVSSDYRDRASRGLRLHRRGARDRRLAAGVEPRRRTCSSRNTRHDRGALRRGTRERRAPRTHAARPRRPDGRRREQRIRGVARADLRRRRRRPDRISREARDRSSSTRTRQRPPSTSWSNAVAGRTNAAISGSGSFRASGDSARPRVSR